MLSITGVQLVNYIHIRSVAYKKAENGGFSAFDKCNTGC